MPPGSRPLAPSRRCTRAVVLAPVVLLAACGSAAEPTGGSAASGSSAPGSSSAAPTGSSPATSGTPGASPTGEGLVVEVDPGDGGAVQRYTLSCGDAPSGDLPDPAGVCAHLSGMADPFAPVPADAVCSQQFGGAQTARVTGSWAGQPVDLQLSRTDGCRISQWDELGPLLPGPVG